MDDPAYTHARDMDLDKFRRGKWLRTQSYTYGQTSSGSSDFLSSSSGTGSSSATSREHRKTAPSGGPSGNGSMFAAANAARGRRAGATVKGLSTLDEDASSSGHEDNESNDLHDSPCPPPSKGPSRMSSLGSGRPGLDRPGSFSSTMMSRR